ncbi:MAG: DNA-binding NtrC family response regulator, partial [Candidatus Marinamargulisbacteria bacterium]
MQSVRNRVFSRTVLVISEKPENANYLSDLIKLTGKSVDVLSVEGFASGIEKLKSISADVILLDVSEDSHGIEQISEVYSKSNYGPILVLASGSNESFEGKAVRNGAQKTIDSTQVNRESLRLAIDFTIERHALTSELQKNREDLRFEKVKRRSLQEALQSEDGESAIIEKSEKIQETLFCVDRVAATDATVLLCGESGTGKELIAKEIHRKSKRREGP